MNSFADDVSLTLDRKGRIPDTLDMTVGQCGCAVCQGKSIEREDASSAVAPPRAAADPAARIGGSVTGTISAADEIDSFTVNLTSGMTYLFGLNGSGTSPLDDPRIQMFDRAGVLVADNDDSGVAANSLFAFTATYTGEYRIAARGFAGDVGQYALSVERRGADDVSGTRANAVELAIGASRYEFLENGADVDGYAVKLVAGTAYSFAVAGVDVLPRGDPLVAENETALVIRDATGAAVVTDGPTGSVTFVAESSGTFFIDVASPAGDTGGYQLSTRGFDLAEARLLDSITVADAAPMPRVVSVYFARAGEQVLDETGLAWSAYERGQAMLAFAQFEEYLAIDVRVTDDPAAATFKMVKTNGPDVAYATNDGETRIAVFSAANIPGWDDFKGGGLEQGGFGFSTIGHELAHGFGIAHPFGGGVETMLGTDGDPDELGLFDLNQGVYTNTSYTDGWVTHPDFDGDGDRPAGSDQRWGANNAVMALDIALMQRTVGANTTHAAGDDRYLLPERNAGGTFYDAIWDTGGVDLIEHRGTQGATIDLRAATLRYEEGGGGRVSFADGVFGGFTIANGVVIENARSAGGADTLIGNEAANRLEAGGGVDLLVGLGGADALDGGAGDDWLAGGAGADTLTGGAGSDIFFFERDATRARDRIVDFGATDLLVTTAKIRDGNNDGVIALGRNGALDLPGGGGAAITDANGAAVKALRFNGSHVEGGVEYFVYDLSGKSGTAGFAARLDDYDLM